MKNALLSLNGLGQPTFAFMLSGVTDTKISETRITTTQHKSFTTLGKSTTHDNPNIFTRNINLLACL